PRNSKWPSLLSVRCADAQGFTLPCTFTCEHWYLPAMLEACALESGAQTPSAKPAASVRTTRRLVLSKATKRSQSRERCCGHLPGNSLMQILFHRFNLEDAENRQVNCVQF